MKLATRLLAWVTVATVLVLKTNGQCFKAECGTNKNNETTLCLKQTSGNMTTGGVLQYLQGVCDYQNRQYCHQYSDSASGIYKGVCKTNTSQFEYFPRYLQYPGEKCDTLRALYDCAFGYKKCKAHRCLGYSEGNKCLASRDCNPNYYCDPSSKSCMASKDDLASCASSDECKKDSRCAFTPLSMTLGKCTNYFTLKATEVIYAWTPEDLFLCKDGMALLEGLQGEVGVVDFRPGSYVCGGTLKSDNAGGKCVNYTDCPTNREGVYAQCGCTYEKETPICGVLHSNTEYQDYISSTKEFFYSTVHCHNSRELEDGPCDQVPLFKDMMCKKMKAKHYFSNSGAPQCIETYSNKFMFPGLDETSQWCNSDARFDTILGLSFGRTLKAAIALAYVAFTLLMTIY